MTSRTWVSRNAKTPSRMLRSSGKSPVTRPDSIRVSSSPAESTGTRASHCGASPANRSRSAESDSRMFRAVKYGISLSRWLISKAKTADLIYCRFLTESALTVVLLKALKIIDLPLIACPGCFGKSGDVNIIQSIPGWKFLVPLIKIKSP